MEDLKCCIPRLLPCTICLEVLDSSRFLFNQRHYVWSKIDQWEPLWEDIVEKIEVNAKAEVDQDRIPHFFGAIVTRQLPRTVGGVPGFDVIDGQQRLTTFQIILCAISDVCLSEKLNDIADQAGRIYNKFWVVDAPF